MSPQETAVRLGAMEAFGITGETKVFDDAKLLKKLAKAEGIEKPNFDIWNPLRDNGIAHTIAVKRGIEIRYDHDAEQVECYYDSQCDQWLSVSWKDCARIVAVNRAICLAAIMQDEIETKHELKVKDNLIDSYNLATNILIANMRLIRQQPNQVGYIGTIDEQAKYIVKKLASHTEMLQKILDIGK